MSLQNTHSARQSKFSFYIHSFSFKIVPRIELDSEFFSDKLGEV